MKTKVNAFKINKKTIVIKGYNEDIDNLLLNTIKLGSESIETITPSYDNDIVPTVIDISFDEDVVELSDDGADIVEYEVVSGDNLSSIAKTFNITVDTILWANDLNLNSSVKIGQKLVILPVSGVSYKVKSGDTISGLASRFNVSEKDIVNFNKTENNKLVIGTNVIIPGAKISNNLNSNNVKKPSNNTGSVNKTSNNTLMAKPIGSGSVKTQGIHGHNAIDFGAPIGTNIYAALDGVVTLVRSDSGWNGGYGNYVVIKHKNGVQTLYAHLDTVSVKKGDNISKSEIIAKSGNTGRSTGPHLHFEVRGTRNPF